MSRLYFSKAWEGSKITMKSGRGLRWNSSFYSLRCRAVLQIPRITCPSWAGTVTGCFGVGDKTLKPVSSPEMMSAFRAGGQIRYITNRPYPLRPTTRKLPPRRDLPWRKCAVGRFHRIVRYYDANSRFFDNRGLIRRNPPAFSGRKSLPY